MSTLRIIYENGNGIAIIVPAPEMFENDSRTRQALEARGISFQNDEEIMQFIIDKDVPANTEYYVVDDSNINSDRTFRNAWVKADNGVSIDCAAARDLALNSVRERRKIEFDKIGVPVKLAPELETAILSDETKAKLQQLREITEPLKELDVADKIDDEQIITTLKQYMSDDIFNNINN